MNLQASLLLMVFVTAIIHVCLWVYIMFGEGVKIKDKPIPIIVSDEDKTKQTRKLLQTNVRIAKEKKEKMIRLRKYQLFASVVIASCITVYHYVPMMFLSIDGNIISAIITHLITFVGMLLLLNIVNIVAVPYGIMYAMAQILILNIGLITWTGYESLLTVVLCIPYGIFAMSILWLIYTTEKSIKTAQKWEYVLSKFNGEEIAPKLVTRYERRIAKDKKKEEKRIAKDEKKKKIKTHRTKQPM